MMIKKPVEQWVNEVDYSNRVEYIPSQFALEFVTFIKLVNGSDGEEHKTPVMHMKMLDEVHGKKQNICNLCYRGAAKTTIMAEYLFLYLAVYGSIPGFGEVTIAIYVSDSIENGVKNMRKNLEYRWENSDFLKKYVPKTRFTDVRYEFENIDGKKLIVKGYGARTGVRGAKEQGRRVDLAILDDLMSDEDAKSPTVISNIEATVYKAIDYALHPTRSKVIWSGTPFNQKDPLYKAIESGGWHVNVYPVCEDFGPTTTREEFRGAWEDRHTYDYVKDKYDKAVATGQIAAFNQELMLRIMSDEDRLITDEDIVWYKRSNVLDKMENYNYYITTDLAVSSKDGADFGVISVWAINNNGDMLWVDGTLKRQKLSLHLDDLFRLVRIYKKPHGYIEVGIELDGQQAGFLDYIRERMMTTNTYFTLAKERGKTYEGIRAAGNGNKHHRFKTMQPKFSLKKIRFPEELKDSPIMVEAMAELRGVSNTMFKSKHDDFLDTITQLNYIDIIAPSENTDTVMELIGDVWYEHDIDDIGSGGSSVVF